MLVPRNPRDDDPLWAALATSLRGVADFHVVRDGHVVAQPAVTWNDVEADRLVAALKARPLRFVGARHGLPLAPHFAVTVDDGADGGAGTANLVELVTMRFRGDHDRPAGRDLLHDLGVVAACVSQARPTLSVLRTPLLPPVDVETLPEGVAVEGGVLVLDLRAF
jgi:hypothetical protein